jgi:hypothetical protein
MTEEWIDVGSADELARRELQEVAVGNRTLRTT